MRVGFDISQLAHKGGVVTYTQNLTQEFSKIKELDMVYFYSSLRKTYHGDLKNVKKYRLPPTLFEMLFNQWRNVEIERFLGQLNVFHSSDWTQPPTKAKKVTTYHDVIPLKYPQGSHPKIVAVHRRRLKIVEKEIDMVIAVSQATKKDLLEISSIPEEKITVIYEGPTADFKPQSEKEISQFKKKYNLPKQFILAIGGVGKRKNLERIKEACKNYNLVISGQTIPWLETEELELLYASADVLVYASLYEGFGLPILDAFSVGCPVITSKISSMPEIGGEAVMYVDPYNLEDIKEKLKLVLNDNNLRKSMIEKGFKRVKLFSWEKCARETAETYMKVMR